MTTILFLRYQE
jgi:hypothetical protein